MINSIYEILKEANAPKVKTNRLANASLKSGNKYSR